MAKKGSRIEMKDIIQERESEGIYKMPIYRVWAHPYAGGDDYWHEFNTLKEAQDFHKRHAHAPDARFETPLVAYKGNEMSVRYFKKKYGVHRAISTHAKRKRVSGRGSSQVKWG